jgi:trimeric autotransporter adhesin
MRPQTLRLGTGAATALLLALSAQPAAAQANELPALIHACYVPNTGSIYRIKTEDTKENCSSPKHVEFSWSQEGTLDHSELFNLDQDDHPQYLLAEGVRESLAGFAVTGTLNVGSDIPPVSGPGARLMWFPKLAAFRAGQALGTEWDLENIGSRSVALGANVTASGGISTAMGANTTASGDLSTALGNQTTASGRTSTAMGGGTTASGGHSTAMGFNTTAAGSLSTAMGSLTHASGDFSTAMGRYASTGGHSGAFVYGDASDELFGDPITIRAAAPNQFVVRAQWIWLGRNNIVTATSGRFLETSTGAFLSTGGVWTNASSRGAKENFRAVDAEEVLRKVAELEVPSWNYRSEEADVRHVGPVAQDFYRAFGLGGTDEAISTVDLGGVNMLAIQALERRTAELARELEAVCEENGALRRHNHELERRLARLEALLRPRMEPGASERP